MRWKHLPIVAFDTETTGRSPFAGDRVIEVAAVVFTLDESGSITERKDHSWLVNPGMPIPRSSTEIHGITDKDVARAPRFDDIAEDVHALFRDAITIAHNYAFDLSFLEKEFKEADLEWPDTVAEVDTYDVSLRHFIGQKGHKLSDFCERLGVPLVGAHRATNDAAACGLAWLELAKRHQVADDLQAMLDWANAIGRPPEDAPIAANDAGHIVFLAGPFAGEPIAAHPVHLAWMEKARAHVGGRWTFRYPEPARRWVRRWLDVRGAGRIRPGPKGFRPEDWGIDSCIAIDSDPV